MSMSLSWCLINIGNSKEYAHSKHKSLTPLWFTYLHPATSFKWMFKKAYENNTHNRLERKVRTKTNKGTNSQSEWQEQGNVRDEKRKRKIQVTEIKMSISAEFKDDKNGERSSGWDN